MHNAENSHQPMVH